MACVAGFYPCYFGATLIVHVLPALMRSSITGASIVQYGLSPFGAFTLVSADAGGAWLNWFAPAAVGAALLTIRRWPAVVGLLVAQIGVVMAWPLGRGLGRGDAVRLAVGVLLLTLGLRRLIRAAPAGRYYGRILFLAVGFALPLLVLPLLLPQRKFAFDRFVTPALLALVVSLIVSLRWRESGRPRPGWIAFACGLIATVGLMVGAPRIGAALQQRQQRAAAESNRTAMADVPAIDTNAPYEVRFLQKGVNFTAEYPAGYASQQSRETLRMLTSYGVNAIALVPYGSIISPRRFGGGWESDEGIEQLSRVAHSLGVKVMLKPQLWGRTWPADFEPASETDRREWFQQYATLVEHYAKLATRVHADLFCIGTELAKLTRHEAEWRGLIAKARIHYRGPITYAAIQGPEFETLRFWDALDYIGLSNYYPLPDSLDTTAVVAKVEAVQKKFGKPVVFAEAGFSSFEAPHRAPWDETPRKLAPEDQARCYEALFNAFYRKPWFDGFYWWKVGTTRYGGASDGSHTPWGKPAMDVMKRWYTQGSR